jgi:6-phosphogluconate dehydrogenase
MTQGQGVNFGMVGLGRMGANIVRRLHASNISSVVFDLNASAVESLVVQGSVGSTSYADMVEKIASPRTIWVMVPAAVTTETIEELSAYMQPGDTIIDGGNSYYRNDLENSRFLAGKGINFVDVGTSGGVYGLERGYSLMIGGDSAVVKKLSPIFRALAPGFENAARTPGRVGEISDSELGFLHCGPVGSGHYVKMIHNGIEYGMMAAFAEGLGILDAAKEADPAYQLDIPEISEVWRRGSVVASWLLDLTAQALIENPSLDAYSPSVSDSGEGRWTVQAAIETGVPAPVLSAALFSRFSSRGNDEFSNKVLSAMRYKFGGHNEHPKKA